MTAERTWAGAFPLTDVTGALPGWPVQVAAVLLEGMAPADTGQWARQVQDQLARMAARHRQVPFTVVHHWHSGDVGPLLAEAAGHHGEDPAAQHAVTALHDRALAGEAVPEEVWRATLEPALRQVYRWAYAYQDAYTTASDAARAFALSRGYDEAEATAYGESYAQLNTEANARVHAEANASANAAAAAAAFAGADPAGYAACVPYAHVRACLRAYAGGDGRRHQW